MSKKFDNTIRDSQSTSVEPINPKDFDFEAYKKYADELNLRCGEFNEKKSGVLVYRRMRALKKQKKLYLTIFWVPSTLMA